MLMVTVVPLLKPVRGPGLGTFVWPGSTVAVVVNPAGWTGSDDAVVLGATNPATATIRTATAAKARRATMRRSAERSRITKRKRTNGEAIGILDL
jgi:hypothetical protein